jgi:hypothetical protein
LRGNSEGSINQYLADTIANVFFKSSMIEAWGRKFEKIKEACGLYD